MASTCLKVFKRVQGLKSKNQLFQGEFLVLIAAPSSGCLCNAFRSARVKYLLVLSSTALNP